jgi:hypothetical protein
MFEVIHLSMHIYYLTVMSWNHVIQCQNRWLVKWIQIIRLRRIAHHGLYSVNETNIILHKIFKQRLKTTSIHAIENLKIISMKLGLMLSVRQLLWWLSNDNHDYNCYNNRYDFNRINIIQVSIPFSFFGGDIKNYIGLSYFLNTSFIAIVPHKGAHQDKRPTWI